MSRLKKSAASPPGEWTSIINTLSKRLGLKRIPVLMESSLVNVPLTFGFLKATILIPLSLLSHLPPSQVEAVLLHELAHIRRNDYLANLIQNSAELFFFFNPGLRWLSTVIRQERESCCDEIVLQHTAQKQTYLEALLSFQEYSLSHAYPAMGIASNRNALLRRVQRILTNENQNLNSMEKTFLIMGIVAISALGFIDAPIEHKTLVHQTAIAPATTLRFGAFSVTPSVISVAPAMADDLKKKQPKVGVTMAERDTVPKPRTKTSRYSNVTTKSSDDGQTKVYEVEATDVEGKTIRLKKLNDDLTELEVDGKKLEATNEFRDHMAQIEQLEKNAAKELIEVQKMEHKIMKEKMEVQKKEFEVLKEKMEVQKKGFAKQHEDFRQQHKELLKAKGDKMPEIEKVQMELNEVQKVMDIERKTIMKEKEMIRKITEGVERQKPYRESNDEVSSIINELSNRGLLTNPDVLSFTLSKKELIVNGKKGPDDLQESLIRKYIKKDGDHFSYSKSGGNSTTTITKE